MVYPGPTVLGRLKVSQLEKETVSLGKCRTLDLYNFRDKNRHKEKQTFS
jgi:hypothetical protein